MECFLLVTREFNSRNFYISKHWFNLILALIFISQIVRMEYSNEDSSTSDSVKETETKENGDFVLDEILRIKQERLKILSEFNKEHEDETMPLIKDVQDTAKKKLASTSKKKTDLSPLTPIRRSERISSKTDDEHNKSTPKQQFFTVQIVERPPNNYGPVPGIEIGTHWDTRMECSYDGVHRPTVAGIHPGPKGAYSIALSGGYPEDVDEGEKFTYTGVGGRNLRGTAIRPKNLRIAPQTRDQDLEGANFSLVTSIKTGKPVRVIRGYKLDSVYAPERGYRYDGLYKVVEYWEDFGKTGFRIYRFKLVRIKNQEPPPWNQPNNTFKKYYSSIKNENIDPNLMNSGEDCSKVQSRKSTSTIYNIIDSIESKDEAELDNDIKDHKEKLCQSSVYSSAFYKKMYNLSPDSSFSGWE